MIAALVKLNAIPIDGTWEFYNNIEEVATGLQVYEHSHKKTVDFGF